MTDPVTPSSSHGGSRFSSLKGWLLPAAVLALFFYLQWPMIKGAYYRETGSSTAAAETVAWQTDFEQALAQSAKTGKPLLIDFSASWCPPCQVMKHDVWPVANVREAVEAGFIPVLLDIDVESNKAIAQRYGISSIPHVIVADGQGKVLRQSGYMDESQIVEFLAGKG